MSGNDTTIHICSCMNQGCPKDVILNDKYRPVLEYRQLMLCAAQLSVYPVRGSKQRKKPSGQKKRTAKRQQFARVLKLGKNEKKRRPG